jgi:peptidoglycan hydrolase-like protein with peptidoglycan-binding domain
MKKILIASGIAAFAFAAVAAAATTDFQTNLTVGSTGSDVAALQTWLISNGFNIPAIQSGATTPGYFGSQTQAAVELYQASKGIPNTGFVGPLTRAALNGSAMAMTPVTTGCPVGFTCTPTTPVVTPTCPAGLVCTPVTTTTTGTVTAPTGITTPGVPGILSVTSGPLSSTVLNVGQTQAPVLAIRVQAQYSDLSVQSINLDLGNNTSIFNKLFTKIYVTDETTGAVLASEPLNSSTVIQSGNNYIVGLAGFNFIVPKGTYKDIIIKADLMPSIDSSYLEGGSNYPSGSSGQGSENNINNTAFVGWGIGLDANQLRAVDGAGINLTNSSAITPTTLTINKSLVDNAQANLSVDGSSPTTNSVPVSDTINGNYLGLPVFTFDIYAQNDTLHLHNVAVNIGTTQNGTTGSVTAAYLFQGSTQVQSASVVGGVATFSNITDGTNGATIPVGTTVPYTVKVDVTGVTAGNLAITASTSVSGSTIYNSIDGNVAILGSALGNTISVSGNGPSFSLASAPSIMTTGSNQSGNTQSTSSIVASFPISITSIGTDTYFGTPASSTPSFEFTVLNSAGSIVYNGTTGSNSGGLSNVKVILPTLPTSVTNGVSAANSFKVANQNTVALGTIQFQFDGKGTNGNVLTGGPYKVNLAAITYDTASGPATTTFMNGLAAWTTPTGTNP